MLLLGPPQIWMVVVPFVDKAFAIDGCVTTMGVGFSTLTIAAAAIALTGVLAAAPTSLVNPVATLRVMVTRNTFTGSDADSDAGSSPTVAAAGKSKATVSFAVPPKPFFLAWTQGVT